MNAARSTALVLAAASALVIACGGMVEAPASSATNAHPGAVDAGPAIPVESPGPWAPSRAVPLDRFALETALGVTLTGPAGEELTSSTRWTLRNVEVELRLDVRSTFSRAEAEQVCAAAAGSGARLSLALGTPTWSTADAVYVTREARCIRVSVARGSRPDLAGAGAVAGALVAG
jgi:hypothetical protein